LDHHRPAHGGAGGVHQSLAQAEPLLADLSGWDLDDETIRPAIHTAAPQVATTRPQRTEAPRFAVAAGVATDPRLALAGYFAKHPTRLGYAERWAGGRSIGSGLVAGSIKQLLQRRRKRTGSAVAGRTRRARSGTEGASQFARLAPLLDRRLILAKSTGAPGCQIH
jgi:hypothetical protein